MSKIFIVSSTMRKDGNSFILAQEFAKGAIESNHQVNFINLADINLKFCIGCLHCQSHKNCVLQDSMNSLYEDIQKSDILVFATPVYYYQMSGQLKTFLDRLNPLYQRENSFKKVYVLATCADSDKHAVDGVANGIQGILDCFENVKLSGIICATGVTDTGDIAHSDTLKQAYQAGKNI